MAIKTVIYNNNKIYDSSQRPLADIVLVGTIRLLITNVLVDTGAEFLQVPLSAATRAGLNVAAGTPVPVRTAAGTITMTKILRVSVEVEGKLITTDILCHPQGTSIPLLGRHALWRLNDIGFDSSQWLW